MIISDLISLEEVSVSKNSNLCNVDWCDCMCDDKCDVCSYDCDDSGCGSDYNCNNEDGNCDCFD